MGTTFAVMGITGQVGGIVARNLLQAGGQVRAVVRDPRKASAWADRGVEIAVAAYDDAAALTAAFQCVDGVFVMMPPNYAPEPGFPETRRILAAIRQALAAALPSKAVYLSSIGGEQPAATGLIGASHILESEFATLPLSNAFVRAGWFMENCAWDVPAARAERKLYSYLQPAGQPFDLTAVSDIGATAARVLQESWHGTRIVEAAGPRQYTPLDIAAAFTKALGEPVALEIVPRAQWIANFVAQGAKQEYTAPRIEMIDGFNSGWIHFGNPGVEHVQGTETLDTAIARLFRER